MSPNCLCAFGHVYTCEVLPSQLCYQSPQYCLAHTLQLYWQVPHMKAAHVNTRSSILDCKQLESIRLPHSPQGKYVPQVPGVWYSEQECYMCVCVYNTHTPYLEGHCLPVSRCTWEQIYIIFLHECSCRGGSRWRTTLTTVEPWQCHPCLMWSCYLCSGNWLHMVQFAFQTVK